MDYFTAFLFVMILLYAIANEVRSYAMHQMIKALHEISKDQCALLNAIAERDC